MDSHACTLSTLLLRFLCTQGANGHLSHFFAASLHAIDFRCEIGTPCIAIADGTVVEVDADECIELLPRTLLDSDGYWIDTGVFSAIDQSR